MAQERETDQDDDTLDLTEDQIIDDQDDASGDDDQQSDDGDDDQDDGEETIISFDDDADADDQQGDSSTIRRLREQLREKTKRLREIETAAPKPQAIEVGPKPTLAECNYDEDAYEAALDEWKTNKSKAEEQTAAIEEENRRAQESWSTDLNRYAEQKTRLAAEIPDYEEAESIVVSALNPMQQAVAVKAALNPAAFAYALSKSPAKLAELAKQQDPIKLAVMIAQMEATVKTTKRKKGPAIDRPATGSGAMPGGSDKQLEKLEKEAERTGDRTKLINYRKERDARKAKK
jgi:hypothetical protein